LTSGAEVLVRGASRIAVTAGITPLVVGLTVVAFGTSSPEMAVSVMAALSGGAGSDIALGNVVGSNIFNVLFILGLSAMVTPLIVSLQLLRLDVPVMIGASILMLLLALDGRVGRLDGIILFSGVIIYTIFVIYQGRKEAKQNVKEFDLEYGQPAKNKYQIMQDLFLIFAGLALLVLGSNWLVKGAIEIAQYLGISELIISLTIVAAGTSLPEVATSVIASLRGERDIAVGNIIGSNIFNILCVLGLSATVSPTGIGVSPVALGFDIPVMLAVAVICLPIFFSGFLITRTEGFILMTYYVIYVSYLILSATHHDSLGFLNSVVIFFVIPVTLLTLAFEVYQQFRLRKG
jgi:cation:H+ antiporter